MQGSEAAAVQCWETIVHKGESGDFFYVVESGECVVLGDACQV